MYHYKIDTTKWLRYQDKNMFLVRLAGVDDLQDMTLH